MKKQDSSLIPASKNTTDSNWEYDTSVNKNKRHTETFRFCGCWGTRICVFCIAIGI